MVLGLSIFGGNSGHRGSTPVAGVDRYQSQLLDPDAHGIGEAKSIGRCRRRVARMHRRRLAGKPVGCCRADPSGVEADGRSTNPGASQI
jgi:hypothetical protein